MLWCLIPAVYGGACVLGIGSNLKNSILSYIYVFKNA